MKRSLIEAAEDPRALLERLELLAGVATKALEMNRPSEAERLLASVTAECQELAARASTRDELELVGQMHLLLAPLLRRLEAVTGKPWTRCLEVIRLPASNPRLPPRGQA